MSSAPAAAPPAASRPLSGNDGSYGLAPRPEVAPAVLAVLAAAVDQAWPRPRAVVAAPEASPAWRFSGRWWATPSVARRERPWARP